MTRRTDSFFPDWPVNNAGPNMGLYGAHSHHLQYKIDNLSIEAGSTLVRATPPRGYFILDDAWPGRLDSFNVRALSPSMSSIVDRLIQSINPFLLSSRIRSQHRSVVTFLCCRVLNARLFQAFYHWLFEPGHKCVAFRVKSVSLS